MSDFTRFGPLPLLAMAVVLCTTGCPTSKDQVAASQAEVQDQATDPAAGNLAPADSNAAAPTSYSASSSGAQPVNTSGDYNRGSYQGPDDSNYGGQPVSYAPQPPPPLPDYNQPPDPGDGYIWTPGYWAYSPSGYYWVPGGWVEAPYEGALWTPGYWGYRHNRYGFYRGYWGRHIGYYGGIDYGFGYTGFGYQGGYWGGGHFNYNRSYNNVNVSIVHNVYDRPMRDERRGGDRVSFNGGSGGIQVQARPAELAALHEQHAPPMRAQMQNEHVASTNRTQFANVNHGRPTNLAVNQPLTADRNVRVPAAVQMHNQAAPQQQQRMGVQQQQQRQAATQQQQRQAAPQQQQRQAATQQQQREAAPQQQQQRQAEPQQQQRMGVQQQQQRQAAPQQQQRQAAPQQQQQRQAAPQQQQQRQAAPQQQRQTEPQQQQQHQAAPQQSKAAAQSRDEPHPKK